MKFLCRLDKHIWPILGIGLLVLSAKCYIIYPVEHVGESDASAYAEMADSLVHGKWLSVDYISFFFIKYLGIPRPEDHWPPLYSFLIAPFYVLLGKTAFTFYSPAGLCGRVEYQGNAVLFTISLTAPIYAKMVLLSGKESPWIPDIVWRH